MSTTSRVLGLFAGTMVLPLLACASDDASGDEADVTASCESAKLTSLQQTRKAAATALKNATTAKDKKAAHAASDAEKARDSCFAIALEPTKLSEPDASGVRYVVADTASPSVIALAKNFQKAQSGFDAICAASGVQCTNRPRPRGSQAPLNNTTVYVLDNKALCSDKVYVGAYHLASAKQMTTEYTAAAGVVDNGCGKNALLVSQ